mmetsp:Transcript_15230/g.30850  ORF Transcript_15230/g.30850 Transcript_15230/m.30850 type:complete len:365 (-) Transcript_15230:328-1422(-)
MLVCPVPSSLLPVENQFESDSSAEVLEPGLTAVRPNALKNFHDIEKLLEDRRLAIFLDYDGTLTPIVDDPSEAKISTNMRDVVAKVANRFPTAIITGRSISAITNFVKLNSVFYAGSHGFDIRAPGGEKVIAQVGEEYLPLLQKTCKELRKLLKAFPGSLVEDNKYAISAHYRRVDPRHWEKMERIVDDEVAKSAGKLKKGHGKMVFEIRANCDWHKGKAVRHLLTRISPAKFSRAAELRTPTLLSEGKNKHKNLSVLKRKHDLPSVKKVVVVARPSSPTKKRRTQAEQNIESKEPSEFAIYIGDDTTDEDAFRELATSGRGIGIRVLSKGSEGGQQTAAAFTLRNVGEVQSLLEMLWQRNSSE